MNQRRLQNLIVSGRDLCSVSPRYPLDNHFQIRTISKSGYRPITVHSDSFSARLSVAPLLFTALFLLDRGYNNTWFLCRSTVVTDSSNNYIQCAKKKRDRNVFRNIFYNIRAILMKFGYSFLNKFAAKCVNVFHLT